MAIRMPDFSPILSILPQHAMGPWYVKDLPQVKYEEVFMALFPALWAPPQTDLPDPANFEVRSESKWIPPAFFVCGSGHDLTRIPWYL